MPSLKEVIEEEKWLSDRISTQLRTVATVLVAVPWALILSPPPGVVALNNRHLLSAGVLAIGSLLADLVQYIAGYHFVANHREEMERGKLQDLGYPRRAGLLRIRAGAFWAKLVLLLRTLALFGTAVGPALARSARWT